MNFCSIVLKVALIFNFQTILSLILAHAILKCVYCVDTEVTTLVEYNSTTHSESESS